MPETQPPYPDDLACVIFDLDGTLARTSELIFASFNYVAQKHLGKTLAPPEIVALFGPPEDGGLRTLLSRDGAEEAMEDLCRYYEEKHEAMASVHEGVEEMLAFLRGKGVRLALFTGKGRRTTEITLGKLKIDRCFDMVVSGSDVHAHKPDPEGILKILETLSVPPEQALMVGDSVSDIRASRAAGVRAAAVGWDSYDREALLGEEADFVFDSVEELAGWFEAQLANAQEQKRGDE